MKLGKRLTKIEAMVASGYDHIWDCCCDHGLLGAALLARQAAASIHFVDIVADIMQQLKTRLHRFYPLVATSATYCQWYVHCLDAALLPLDSFRGKHLIILAGIGGERMAELVNLIFTKHPSADIDFLLCPVHHQFALRQQLIALNFSLKTETLLKENQRFYEILLVSSGQPAEPPCQKIHPVGSQLWNTTSEEQRRIAAAYLDKTLNHYRRIQRNHALQIQPVIDAYGAVKL